MLTAMERHFPDEVTWTRPDGGLFLWVKLPKYLDAAEILNDAIEQKVAYVPGSAFHPGNDGKNTLRLNFSYCNPEKINEGIKRLGGVFYQAIERHEMMAIENTARPMPVAF